MKSVLGSLTSSRKYGVPLRVGMQCMSPNMNANLYYLFILFLKKSVFWNCRVSQTPILPVQLVRSAQLRWKIFHTWRFLITESRWVLFL